MSVYVYHDPIEWATKSLGHSVYFRFIDAKPCVLYKTRTTMAERYSGHPVCGGCCDAVTQGEFAEFLKGGAGC